MVTKTSLAVGRIRKERAARHEAELAALRRDVATRDTMMSDQATTNAALRERCAKLEAAIKAHNDGCVAACESRQEAQYCDPYIQRGRQCVDCPRGNMIELPVQSAGNAFCSCGDPTDTDTVHRTDGPCYMAEPLASQVKAAARQQEGGK